MAEQTFNEALHGDEVIEAILDRLRQKLRMDCYLNRNSAYDYFKAEISIALTLHDAGVDVKTTADAEFFHDTTPRDQVEEVEHITAALDIAPQPPNTVREETGQPIPVLATDGEGKTQIKRVQYARPSAKQAAKRTAAKAIAVALLMAGVGYVHGQAAATQTPPPANPAALSNTEKIAIDAVQKDASALQQQTQENNAKAQAIMQDLEHAHPGYRFNPQTSRLEPVTGQTPAVQPTKTPMPKFPDKKPDAAAKKVEAPQQK